MLSCAPHLQLATQIVGSLLALEAMDEEAEIRMYINSPGGTPYSVVGVVDAMQAVKCPIQTVALGACYSYSSLILVSRPEVICPCFCCSFSRGSTHPMQAAGLKHEDQVFP